MTSDTADDAIARIQAMPEPWLMVVSFHAPHSPYHMAPEALLPAGSPYPGSGRRRKLYNAMLEAVDTELGRVLAVLPAETSLGTTVMVVGDNGTPEQVLEPAFVHGKGTVYEGGVRVPLIVTGPEVGAQGVWSDALVEVSDVFATVADLAEVDLQTTGLQLDAISFLPQIQDPTAPGDRTHAVSELFDTDRHGAYESVQIGVRDARWRLVSVDGVDELYDIGEDQDEGPDLLASPPLDAEAIAAYDALRAAVPAWWADLGY